MLKANITLKGRTPDELVYALNEVKRLIEEGYVSGNNRNDSGGFTYQREGEEEDIPDEE